MSRTKDSKYQTIAFLDDRTPRLSVRQPSISLERNLSIAPPQLWSAESISAMLLIRPRGCPRIESAFTPELVPY
jgi:hypothetical protein